MTNTGQPGNDTRGSERRPDGNLEGGAGPETQVIFDDRFSLFTTDFAAACEEHKIPVAAAIVIDPSVIKEHGPIVFVRGNKYEIAKTLAMVLRSMKAEIARSLES